MELAECIENVGTDASKMLDAGVFAHPDAVVDARSQMFDEVPVQLRADVVNLSVRKTTDLRN